MLKSVETDNLSLNEVIIQWMPVDSSVDLTYATPLIDCEFEQSKRMADTILGTGKKVTAVKFGGRLKRLLLTPAKEFERISPEPETVRAVLTVWIIPIVLIMIIANVIRALVFGMSVSTFSNPANYRVYPSLLEMPALALPLMIQSIAMPFVMAFVINVLAGFFGGQRDYVQAVRAAAYVSTPAWLVGVFGPAWVVDWMAITPPLSIGLFIGVLWSVYLLLRALPPMMKSLPGKALVYTAAVSAVMFVLWILALLGTYRIISSLWITTAGYMPDA